MATAKRGTARLLPDYTIRESARAKHVRLRVSVFDGLVVVIPKGFNRRYIPALVAEKRDWIERAQRHIEAHCATPAPAGVRPETIDLAAIGRVWRTESPGTDRKKPTVSEIGPERLRIAGPIGNPDAWLPALRRWLIERGREHLIPWAENLAEELGLSIGRISIRCQKARWGSYSTKSCTVSLNAQLLFLPERLARFVLLHELCHARHPNHSPAFWDLVRSHEPDTDRLRVQLREAWKVVPSWLRQRNPSRGQDV